MSEKVKKKKKKRRERERNKGLLLLYMLKSKLKIRPEVEIVELVTVGETAQEERSFSSDVIHCKTSTRSLMLLRYSTTEY